jgi:AcrR family transcriptional regulator
MSTRKPPPEPEPPRVPSERPGPAGGRRDANRRQRLATLCAAAEELFLASGVGAVTVDQIVSRAGIAKGSFYRYVRDTEELVATVMQPLAGAVRAAMERAATDLARAADAAALTAAYQALAADLRAAAAAHPGLVRLYLQEARAPGVGARRPIRALAGEVERGALELTRAGRAHGLLRADYDLRVGALIVIGAVERILFAYLSNQPLGDPRAVAGDLISVLLDGVRAGPASGRSR